MPFTPPVFTFKFSPSTNPFDTPSWVDISPYVIDFQCKYGRTFELNRIETGTASFTLDNTDRRFDPLNSSSPYYPNLKPMKKFQVTALYNSTTYYIFTGYIDAWPMVWEGPGWSQVECTAVDALESLSQADISSNHAKLTTAQGSNKDLTFTSNGIGAGNNTIRIAYVSTGSLSVSMSGLDITITINAGTTTANQILTAVNANPDASLFVTASLAPGSTGTGTPAAFAFTNLEGGTFAQELSGTRIGKVLDNVGWPTGDRSLDAGQSTVAAQTFRVSDHTKAKTHINDVEASEMGYTFVNGQGFIVYHDRNHRATATNSTVSQATFGDSGSELDYEVLNPSYDKTYIYNWIDVTPYNGNTSQTASDATSISQYMLRTFAVSTQLTSAADALALAQYILLLYKQPQLRFSSMSLIPMNDDGLWTQVLSRTIGDRITVNRRPPDYETVKGALISSACFIESIEWKISPGDTDVQVTYEMSPIATSSGNFLKLDDATLGKLDNGNILAI